MDISRTPVEIIDFNYTNLAILNTPIENCPRPNLPHLRLSSTEADLIGVGAWSTTLDIFTNPRNIVDSDCMDFKIPVIQAVKKHISPNLITTDQTWDCMPVPRQANIEQADSHDTKGELQQPILYQDSKRPDPKQRWFSEDDKESPWVAIGSISLGIPSNP